MERLGPLVATAAAPTVREAAAAARAARTLGAHRVEVRLDLLAPGEDPRALLALAAEMPLLVSGDRAGVCPGEAELLRAAQGLGAWVDLPTDGATDDLLSTLDPARLVLSWHDTEGTPPDLSAVLRRLRSRPAAAHKLVVTAWSLGDALRVRGLLAGAGPGLCAFAMGQAGLLSRALALAWGSEAVYAAAPGSAPAAPGQLPLEDLLACRPLELLPETPLFLLAGWPLAHTRTPLFFNRWLAAAGRPERYLPCPVQDPEEFLGALGHLAVAGAAVTVPHKEAVARALPRLSRLAARAGAVNTLLSEGEGLWRGANTDIFGVRAAVGGLPRRGLRTLVLGAGGAAAAAVLALRSRGPVAVSARKGETANALASRLGAEAVPWEARGQAPWDLLVNATPVGRYDNEAPPLAEGDLTGSAVLDMVVPREGETPLLKAAAARGLTALPGTLMLEAQARLQFRLWTGKRAPGSP